MYKRKWNLLRQVRKRRWKLLDTKICRSIRCIGFSLDIVPLVDEDVSIKNDIINSGVSYSNAEKTVAITNKELSVYDWLTSNPIGFGDREHGYKGLLDYY